MNHQVTAKGLEATGKGFIKAALIRPPNEITLSVCDSKETVIEKMIETGCLAAKKEAEILL